MTSRRLVGGEVFANRSALKGLTLSHCSHLHMRPSLRLQTTSSPVAMQPPKDSRATSSCTECQRRKQKACPRTQTLRALRANGTPSAPANGLVTIVKPEKSRIYVSLV
jgi:hypothetical protein